MGKIPNIGDDFIGGEILKKQVYALVSTFPFPFFIQGPLGTSLFLIFLLPYLSWGEGGVGREFQKTKCEIFFQTWDASDT